MAGKNIRVVPKISNNLIAVYICIPSTGESRQVALVECPNDNQLNDNVELADEICRTYRKRINKRVFEKKGSRFKSGCLF